MQTNWLRYQLLQINCFEVHRCIAKTRLKNLENFPWLNMYIIQPWQKWFIPSLSMYYKNRGTLSEDFNIQRCSWSLFIILKWNTMHPCSSRGCKTLGGQSLRSIRNMKFLLFKINPVFFQTSDFDIAQVCSPLSC